MRTTKQKITSKYTPKPAKKAPVSAKAMATKPVYAEEPKRLPNSVVRNPHKVPARQWGKWSDRARKVFNSMYSYMNKNQDMLVHPKAKAVPDEYWATTARNAAFMAADHVDRRPWGDEAIGPYKPGKPKKEPPLVEVHEADGRVLHTSA